MQHPKIVTAVKTRQAARAALNHNHATVRRMQREGLVDDNAARLLHVDLDRRLKHTQTRGAAGREPAGPEALLRNIPWLKGLDDRDALIAFFLARVTLHILPVNAPVMERGEASAGIFLVRLRYVCCGHACLRTICLRMHACMCACPFSIPGIRVNLTDLNGFC